MTRVRVRVNDCQNAEFKILDVQNIKKGINL